MNGKFKKTQWYTLFQTAFGWCGIVFGIEGIKVIYLPEPQKEKLKKNYFHLLEILKKMRIG